ncbi:exonuclease domain-containing protein [Rathayibacter sp. VKM Ac-2928]|uniref:exonuclease domain-containing protein n=1 Tax=Rathayibacter sp. VKM Ac-2928 TaxID=2929479 RepID=UPI0024371FD7|nr:exonuclease domain-containing protein [Rathayibacter sp. VKM Ac-2928]
MSETIGYVLRILEHGVARGSSCPLPFTAIDFETANEQRASACAVGVAQVTNGVVTYRASTRIRPLTGDTFSMRNTLIHGLTWEDCAGAPEWPAVSEWLGQVVRDAPIVAHNASFEKGVLTASNALAGMDRPTPDLLCSVALSKAHLVLDSYRLPAVARHLGVRLDDHHDAEADAVASAEVVLAIARRTMRDDIAHLWEETRTAKRAVPAARQYGRLADLPQASSSADPDSPLLGEVVVFSGEIEGIPRKEAQSLVARFGATVGSNVTKKTTLVVQGVFGPGELKPGETVSAKILKARELASKGQRVEVIDQTAFLDLLRSVGAVL